MMFTGWDSLMVVSLYARSSVLEFSGKFCSVRRWSRDSVTYGKSQLSVPGSKVDT